MKHLATFAHIPTKTELRSCNTGTRCARCARQSAELVAQQNSSQMRTLAAHQLSHEQLAHTAERELHSPRYRLSSLRLKCGPAVHSTHRHLGRRRDWQQHAVLGIWSDVARAWGRPICIESRSSITDSSAERELHRPLTYRSSRGSCVVAPATGTSWAATETPQRHTAATSHLPPQQSSLRSHKNTRARQASAQGI